MAIGRITDVRPMVIAPGDNAAFGDLIAALIGITSFPVRSNDSLSDGTPMLARPRSPRRPRRHQPVPSRGVHVSVKVGVLRQVET